MCGQLVCRSPYLCEYIARDMTLTGGGLLTLVETKRLGSVTSTTSSCASCDCETSTIECCMLIWICIMEMVSAAVFSVFNATKTCKSYERDKHSTKAAQEYDTLLLFLRFSCIMAHCCRMKSCPVRGLCNFLFFNRKIVIAVRTKSLNSS